MARKHHKPEEIVAKLRQVEVLVGQGKPVAEGVRAAGVDGGDILRRSRYSVHDKTYLQTSQPQR